MLPRVWEAFNEPDTSILEVAAIQEHCKPLRLPTIAESCERLADEAIRERHTHLHFLDALLEAELEERQGKTIARRLREAHLPRVKSLEEFDFTKATALSAAQILSLAAGATWIAKNRSCFWAIAGPARRTWRRDYVWPPVGSGAAYALQRLPDWSTNCWKPNTRTNWGERFLAGRAMIWSALTNWAMSRWPSWERNCSFR